MDNITHSLAGMLVAEAVCTLRRESRPQLRAAAYLVSALANNLPDIDIVYTWITEPAPLGSLLHHRGHTHTVVVALAGALLLGFGALQVFKWRKREFSPGEARVLWGLALAGPLLHLLMDFGNNYGVHPFWPLSGRWFYGDTLFIIEPLWWALTIPVLAHALTRRWLKLLLWVILGAILVASWFVPFVHPASRHALLLTTVAASVVARWGSPRGRLLFAAGGCLAVAAAFATGSARAKAAVAAATEAAFPALSVHDIAATPMPANPLCWEALIAGEQGDAYRVLRASVAVPPLASENCAAGDDVEPTAKVQRLERPQHGGVRWRSEYRAKLDELRQLRRDDCRFRALLKFTRLPYAQRTSGRRSGPVLLKAGDLRYDRQPGRDFSDLVVLDQRNPQECPQLIPGWVEPRLELFEP